MKISYSDSLQQYVCTALGSLIDADPNLSDLLQRHGMIDESEGIDLLNDFDCLPDPVPGEIVAWIDDMPVYAEADPGEVNAIDDLEEILDLSEFEGIE